MLIFHKFVTHYPSIHALLPTISKNQAMLQHNVGLVIGT